MILLVLLIRNHFNPSIDCRVPFLPLSETNKPLLAAFSPALTARVTAVRAVDHPDSFYARVKHSAVATVQLYCPDTDNAEVMGKI